MKHAPPEWVNEGPPLGIVAPSRSTSDALGERLFQQLAEDRFRLDAVDLGVSLELDRVRRDSRGSLVGEMIVYSDLAGAVTFDGVLNAGDLYLTNPRARADRAKILAARVRSSSIDFDSLIEELTLRVCKLERAGQPAIILRDVVPSPTSTATFDVMGLRMLQRHPIIAFGDGSTAKSLLALYIGGVLDARGVRVGYFDWELDAEDHRVRLERLFGAQMPQLRYVRCTRPLIHEADRLRRIVRDEGLHYGIYDSVAPACPGRPEDAEVATGYMRAARGLEIGGLHLAHVSKQEDADRKPFGSAFWHNLARATFNVKLEDTSPDGSKLTVAWIPRKSNLGALGNTVGFELAFSPAAIAITSADISQVDGLAAHLPMKERIRRALGSGPRTIAQIADELDANPETVRTTVKRATGTFTKLSNTDGTSRIALVSSRQP